MIKILFIADVIGSPGRDVVAALLPGLRARHGLDLVVCNGENAAAGFGLTRDTARELIAAGCDVLTGGNHIWDKRDSIDYLKSEPRLVRPANLPPGAPGEGWRVFAGIDGTPVGVINLIGRVFMKEADCPFRTVDLAIESLQAQGVRAILVDFHAETTAEKMAMAWHVDGRVSAVLGTHTHVATADARVFPQGTAFQCDAGMTGGFESVIGMDRHAALRRFLTGMPERLTPSGGDLRLNAVLVEIDPATGHARAIRSIEMMYERAAPASRAGGSLARILSGDEAAVVLRARARTRVAALRETGVTPVLALVSVGEDPASRIYLRRKSEACAEAGIEVRRVQFPAGSVTETVVERVRALGADPTVHGILVQLPLAAPAESQAVLEALPPEKDVDGFHPLNAGRLAQGLPAFAPATPAGILELLRHHQIPLAGRHAVVIGRSNIVGRPLATLLSQKGVDMTVTLGHSASGPELRALAREADLLVAALGRPEAITADWIKPGATVVDVGIHRVPDPSAKTGSRLTGDVDAASVARVAMALSPVPGGVGPMTVAMVVVNTVSAAERLAAATATAPR
ncbi:MAG: TIGR00282 family metallophosphoesterase [Candidatus Eisenbacteria bacterium]